MLFLIRYKTLNLNKQNLKEIEKIITLLLSDKSKTILEIIN